MKKVFLVANHDAFSKQMARWAQVLKRQNEWEPIIYISAGYMERHLSACREDGITVLSAESTSEETNKKPARRLLFPFRVFSIFMRITKHIRLIRNLIRQHGISALMIAESSPAYNSFVYIQAAHLEHIPIVTSPIEQTDAKHYAENYLHELILSLKRPINRLIGTVYPRWVFSIKGCQLVRVAPELILALEWLRLSPPYPWRLLGNREDRVALDSQSTFDFYSSQGVPLEQMAVIGRPEHDMMSEILQDSKALREGLYKRLGLQANRPMLLSALVQDHYISGRPECDFQEYAKMVEFWVKSLGSIDNHNVIISLHPWHTYQQDPHAWDYIEQWGVKICKEDLASLIPLCDIYVVAGSTTIQWAIACGKPVINYDVYRYGQTLYQNTLGVLNVQEQQDFLNALKHLSTDPAYYVQMAAYQSADAEQWGRLDGQAGKRLVRLFDQLSESYRDN